MSHTTFMILLAVFGFYQYVIHKINYKRIIKKLIDHISKDVKIIRREKDE